MLDQKQDVRVQVCRATTSQQRSCMLTRSMLAVAGGQQTSDMLAPCRHTYRPSQTC